MGEIFDNTMALVDIASDFNTMMDPEVKAFGTSIGRLFNMLFYDPEDFETYEESVSRLNNIRNARRASRTDQ